MTACCPCPAPRCGPFAPYRATLEIQPCECEVPHARWNAGDLGSRCDTTTSSMTAGDTTMFRKITFMAAAAAIFGLSGLFGQGAVAQQRLIAHGFDAADATSPFNVR